MGHDRRQFLIAASALAGSLLCAGPTRGMGILAKPPHGDNPPTRRPAELAHASAVRPALLTAALAALDRQGATIQRDRMAVVDFAVPSSQPRFHLVDLAGGQTSSFLVAHGSGSDPDHSGWLERFSNQPGSNASSSGAFRTGDFYVGKHGRSQRLIGLDPTNDNALSRAIVMHGAWYSEARMIEGYGKLGRSQGCFAVGDSKVAEVFGRLGPGRLIYAAKLEG